MGKFEKQDLSIEWKRHDDFFISLNRKLDEISLVGEACYQDIENVHGYFAKVKNLYNKHSSYIQDKKGIKGRLLAIQSELYNVNLIQDLKKGDTAAQRHRLKLFEALQTILTEMVSDFTIPELIPKPIKAHKSMAQNKNIPEEEREEFEALEEIGIKYVIVED